MVAVGGNIMRKTPQEAYDLIEYMTQHHFQWDAEVYHDITIDMSAHYSTTTFASSEQVEVLGNDTGYTIQSIQHPLELNNDPEGDIIFLEKLLEDEPLEAKNSEIDSLIKESTDTFLMGDTETKFNPHEDIDDLVPIPWTVQSLVFTMRGVMSPK
nr:hypothetical protein [Tanacetum cinerariifolium]